MRASPLLFEDHRQAGDEQIAVDGHAQLLRVEAVEDLVAEEQSQRQCGQHHQPQLERRRRDDAVGGARDRGDAGSEAEMRVQRGAVFLIVMGRSEHVDSHGRPADGEQAGAGAADETGDHAVARRRFDPDLAAEEDVVDAHGDQDPAEGVDHQLVGRAGGKVH